MDFKHRWTQQLENVNQVSHRPPPVLCASWGVCFILTKVALLLKKAKNQLQELKKEYLLVFLSKVLECFPSLLSQTSLASWPGLGNPFLPEPALMAGCEMYRWAKATWICPRI